MNKTKDSLGNRMKTYENASKNYLVRRMPVIVRIDGKAFHTFTKGFKKPFDDILIETMWETAKFLCSNIQGCKMAYTQSDEISLLLTDYYTITTSAWFDNNIQKIVSVSASMATLEFNKAFIKTLNSSILNATSVDKIHEHSVYIEKANSALFDSRAFNIPKEDVCNYFIWRQQDATRNSIEMVGRRYFSARQLHDKNCDMVQDILFTEKGVNWNDYPTYKKRGSCILKEKHELEESGAIRSRWVVDQDIPIFTQDRGYIGKLL